MVEETLLYLIFPPVVDLWILYYPLTPPHSIETTMKPSINFCVFFSFQVSQCQFCLLRGESISFLCQPWVTQYFVYWLMYLSRFWRGVSKFWCDLLNLLCNVPTFWRDFTKFRPYQSRKWVISALGAFLEMIHPWSWVVQKSTIFVTQKNECFSPSFCNARPNPAFFGIFSKTWWRGRKYLLSKLERQTK